MMTNAMVLDSTVPEPPRSPASFVRVLQVTESLGVEFGGIAATFAQLTAHLAQVGVRVSAVTFGEAGSLGGSRWLLDPAVDARVCTRAWPRRLGYSPDFSSTAASLPPPNIVHLHGLWRAQYVQAASYAHRLALPVVISVHGMLHEAALRQNGELKRIARWLFQDRLLQTAQCLHTTATDEADEVRRLGFTAPIAVIPWGVDVPESDGPAARSNAATPPDRRVLLYLGRLHPSKGVEFLLRAWAQVHGRFDAWRLVIAGYDQGGYSRTLVTLASALGLADSISWPGAVEGDARERLFGAASLVVLPSFAENFGLVVAEALARGVPVIATQGTPWSSLVDARCGWWIPFGVEALAVTLNDALGRPAEELRTMGERGRRFVRARFAWDAATTAMTELYGWVLEQRPEPAFVRH